MHVKLLRRLLQIFARDNRLILFTDGTRQYRVTDIYPDDKNPFVYVELERED